MSIKIEAGKYYRTRDGRKVGPIYVHSNGVQADWPFSDGQRTYSKFGIWHVDRWPHGNDLIAKWIDAPAHIIQSSNGREYDLTAVKTPFGLLPDDVQDALRNWPHGLLSFNGIGWDDMEETPWSTVTYRARPAPKVTEHVLYWNWGAEAMPYQQFSDTHRITIRDDGNGNLTAEVEPIK